MNFKGNQKQIIIIIIVVVVAAIILVKFFSYKKIEFKNGPNKTKIEFKNY